MYHSEYIMPKGSENVSPLIELGLNYIRFGYEEEELFKFLFQTTQFSGYSLDELIDSAELSEILHMVSMGMGCDEARAICKGINAILSSHVETGYLMSKK